MTKRKKREVHWLFGFEPDMQWQSPLRVNS